MMIVKSSYYVLRRMLRNYIGMGILLVTPIALITVLGMIAGDGATHISPQQTMVRAEIAIMMIFNFQVFGGFVMMECMRDDFIGGRKWRIRSLPYHAHLLALSTLLGSVLFNVLQGFVIVIYTHIIFGIQWGNLALVTLALASVSTLSQLIFLNILLGVKKYKTAETLGTSFGLLMLILSEAWFELPQGILFEFLSTYGNLISLGRNILVATMTGENVARAFISFGVLIGASVVMLMLAKVLGRRTLR